MRLLLFDIDGTLIRSNSAGRLAMGAALQEMFGTTGTLADYHMGGKTDARIFTDLLTVIGVNSKEIAAKLPHLYALMAEKAEAIYPQKEVVSCAGVAHILSVLGQTPDVVVGLLTGNAQLTAPLKIQAAGIDPQQFLVGAYGSEALDRNLLPALAIERASTLTGYPFTGNNTVVIGDTPADILCARAGKATAVAVASGWHSADTLAKYNPDFLLGGELQGGVQFFLGLSRESSSGKNTLFRAFTVGDKDIRHTGVRRSSKESQTFPREIP